MKIFEETPLVIVLGPSGRGKSTSIRNLDPKSTVIFNTEQKPLPFKGASKFLHNYKITDPKHLKAGVKKFSEDETVSTIVVDSFSAWSDMLSDQAYREYTGWDRQTYYNKSIYDLFQTIKKSKKIVILMAHGEVVETTEGENMINIKVENKKWKGSVDKEAVVILYARMIRNSTGKNEYFFETQTDGATSAKSPVDMFTENLIPNDLNLVVKAINEYYE